MNNLLSHPVAVALSWAIIHSLWQFVVLVGLARMVARLLREARHRHTVYLLALCGMPLVFMITLLGNYVAAPTLAITGNESVIVSLSALPQAVDPELTALDHLRRFLPYLSVVYLLGLSVVSLRGLRDYFRGNRLRRGAHPPTAEWRERYDQLKRRFAPGLRATWRISERVTTALTVGLIRPVILMPVALLNQLSVDEVEAILLHEIAHVKRGDQIWNALQVAVQSLFFYHPLVHWLGRRLDREREFACDDFVTTRHSREVYAQSLLSVARFSITHENQFVMQAQGKSSFTHRIQRLFQQDTNPRPSRMPLLLAIFVLPLLYSSARWLPAQPEPVKKEVRQDPILVNGEEDKTVVRAALTALDAELAGLDGLDGLDALDAEYEVKDAWQGLDAINEDNINIRGTSEQQISDSSQQDSIPRGTQPNPQLKALLGPGFDYENTAVFINGKRWTGNDVYDLSKLEIAEVRVMKSADHLQARSLKGYAAAVDITTQDRLPSSPGSSVLDEGERTHPVVKGKQMDGGVPTVSEALQLELKGTKVAYLIDDLPATEAEVRALDPETVERVDVIKGKIDILDNQMGGTYDAAIVVTTKSHDGREGDAKTTFRFHADKIRFDESEDEKVTVVVEKPTTQSVVIRGKAGAEEEPEVEVVVRGVITETTPETETVREGELVIENDPNDDILWILDGKIMETGGVEKLDPERIKSIDVYKGKDQVDALGYATGHKSAIVIVTKK